MAGTLINTADMIAARIRTTNETAAAMILLQAVDTPFSVLKVEAEGVRGEMWIERGRFVRYARTWPSAGPWEDMLKMLQTPNARFSLEPTDLTPPADVAFKISISEIVADDLSVRQQLTAVTQNPAPEFAPDLTCEGLRDSVPAVSQNDLEYYAAAWQGLDKIPTPKPARPYLETPYQKSSYEPQDKRELVAGCEQLISQRMKITAPRKFCTKEMPASCAPISKYKSNQLAIIAGLVFLVTLAGFVNAHLSCPIFGN